VSYPLLLDEMLSDDIADQLRKRGHDVLAVVADTGLVGLADEPILARAAAMDRALVTANIKDFIPLDAEYQASGRQHAGLIFISTKTFPQNRSFTGAVVDEVAALLTRPDGVGPARVVFLGR
jgi:hypothetical protein